MTSTSPKQKYDVCNLLQLKLWLIYFINLVMQILPVNIKGLAGSVATLGNWMTAWVVTMTANLLLDWSSAGLPLPPTLLPPLPLLQLNGLRLVTPCSYTGTKCRRGVLSCSLSLSLTNTWNYLFYFYSFFILLFLFYYSFYWCITNSGCLCYRQEPSPSTCSCLLSLWHLLWFGSLKLKEELSKKFSGPSDKIFLSFSSSFFPSLLEEANYCNSDFDIVRCKRVYFFFPFHKDFFFFLPGRTVPWLLLLLACYLPQ